MHDVLLGVAVVAVVLVTVRAVLFLCYVLKVKREGK